MDKILILSKMIEFVKKLIAMESNVEIKFR